MRIKIILVPLPVFSTIKNYTETAANPNIKISTDNEQSHDQSHDESADAAEEDQQEATGEPAKPEPPSIGQLLTQVTSRTLMWLFHTHSSRFWGRKL